MPETYVVDGTPPALVSMIQATASGHRQTLGFRGRDDVCVPPAAGTEARRLISVLLRHEQTDARLEVHCHVDDALASPDDRVVIHHSSVVGSRTLFASGVAVRVFARPAAGRCECEWFLAARTIDGVTADPIAWLTASVGVLAVAQAFAPRTAPLSSSAIGEREARAAGRLLAHFHCAGPAAGRSTPGAGALLAASLDDALTAGLQEAAGSRRETVAAVRATVRRLAQVDDLGAWGHVHGALELGDILDDGARLLLWSPVSDGPGALQRRRKPRSPLWDVACLRVALRDAGRPELCEPLLRSYLDEVDGRRLPTRHDITVVLLGAFEAVRALRADAHL